MSSGDDQQSVRVEVDGDGGSADVAFVEGASSLSLPVIFGVILVAAVGVILFLLRPANDETAGGEQPADVTSTTIPVDEDGETESRTVEVVQQTGPLGAAIAEAAPWAPIEAAITDFPSVPSRIVETEVGFLALDGSVLSFSPRVFGSVDGQSWVAVEVTNQTEEAQQLRWFNIFPSLEGLAAAGTANSPNANVELATSESGVVWRRLETPDLTGEQPVAVTNDSIVSFSDVEEFLLEDILNFDGSSAIQAPISGICGGFGGSDDTFTIRLCPEFGLVNNGVGPTGGENPVSNAEVELTNSNPAFDDCVEQASLVRRGGFVVSEHALSEPEVDQEPESDTASPSFIFAASRFSDVVPLGGERVAVLDEGTIGLVASCDAAGGPFRREAGVVVIDFAEGASSTFEAPLALRPELQRQAAADGFQFIEILGEAAVAQDRSHILVAIDRALWSIDTLTGGWTQLIGPIEGLEGEDQQGQQSELRPRFGLSSSGTRLYQLAGDRVAIIDLSTDDGGALVFDVVSSPFIVSPADQEHLAGGFIEHATDGAILVVDRRGFLWRFAIAR